MNPAEEHFVDRQARQAHAAALAQLSPRTLAALRDARRQAHAAAGARRRAWPWLTATAFSAMLALAVGLQWLPGTAPAPAASMADTLEVAAEEIGTANDLLEENPDLYLWLASSEAQPLAME